MKKTRALLLLFPLLVATLHAQTATSAMKDVGTQKEGDWVDDRWNQVDLGDWHMTQLDLPSGKIARGLVVKVRDAATGAEGAVAYDLDTMSLRAAWMGKMLQFDPARYGLIKTPKPGGELVFEMPPGAVWQAPVKWKGLRIADAGPRLEYLVGDVLVAELPRLEIVADAKVVGRTFRFPASKAELQLCAMDFKSTGSNFRSRSQPSEDNQRLIGLLSEPQKSVHALATVHSSALPQLTPRFTTESSAPQKRHISFNLNAEKAALIDVFLASDKNGRQWEDFPLDKLSLGREKTDVAKPRWLPLPTKGQRATATSGYAIDTLTMPYDNPWKALLFASGVDVLPDGDVLVCTLHGDVWKVSGVDDTLGNLTWRRFATGLHFPQGVRVRDGQIFVLCHDQITRLHDENHDGEADFYECFSQQVECTLTRHEYPAGLELDDAGNFYWCDPFGVWRLSADGKTRTQLGGGLRNPNGIGVRPDAGIVTVAPQEGNWTPATAIFEAGPDRWFGFGGPKPTDTRPLGYDAPLCWMPKSADNSAASQFWLPQGWGPLGGRMVHLSFGHCSWLLAYRDAEGGPVQGGVSLLPGRFLSGVMRPAFSKKENALYLAGTRGWQTSAVRDGSLQRVRWTGKNEPLLLEVRAHTNGLALTFSDPLDPASAADPGSYGVEQWNYRYAQTYGSKDWSVADPNKEGRDEVPLTAARLSPDGKTVFLTTAAPVVPVMQMGIKFNLKPATPSAKEFRGETYLTIHAPRAEWKE